MVDDDKLVDYLKRVTADLQRTRQRVQELEAGAAEPIAIVGDGLPLPRRRRARPEDLWRAACADGGDAIAGFPADRGWDLDASTTRPRRPGTTTRRAGRLPRTTRPTSTPEFFGISPREALAMDPQQRLLLETSWEALERAGHRPRRAARQPTPACSSASSTRTTARAAASASTRLEGLIADRQRRQRRLRPGRLHASASRGPAITVDTACSSSLVALHLAVQALRRGECSLALAGGVTVMADPGLFVEFSRQRGLAPDGRCKAFAAAADGTGWAEGVGVLLLERLSDARRTGHPVLAVVRGTAVNQDGACNGLTAPNGPAQQRVIRAGAGRRPARRRPTSTRSRRTAPAPRSATRSRRRRCSPPTARTGPRTSRCGSARSSPTSATPRPRPASAGVIKMVLAMRHGVLPRTLHVDEPSPARRLVGGRRRLLTEAQAVAEHRPAAPRRRLLLRHQRHQRPRHPRTGARAASGADGAPGAGARHARPAAAVAVGAVRRERARRCAPRPAAAPVRRRRTPDARPLDIAHSLATTRARLRPPRRRLGARPRPNCSTALGALGRGRARRPASCAAGTGRAASVAFLFTGQGASGPAWAGTVRGLPGVRPRLRRGVRPARPAPRRRRCDDVLDEARRGRTAADRPDRVRASRAVRPRGRAVPAAGVVGRRARLPRSGTPSASSPPPTVAGVLSLADACTPRRRPRPADAGPAAPAARWSPSRPPRTRSPTRRAADGRPGDHRRRQRPRSVGGLRRRGRRRAGARRCARRAGARRARLRASATPSTRR